MEVKDKSDQMFIHRLEDLSRKANAMNWITNTDFLNQHQLSLAKDYLNKSGTLYQTYGGYNQAERVLLFLKPTCVFDDFDYDYDDYVMYIRMQLPFILSGKNLTHRDYLGALMSLGIERKLIGDLLVDEQGMSLICMASIGDYIMNQMVTIGRNKVNLSKITKVAFEQMNQQSYKNIQGTVASLRLDNILKLGTGLSRQKSVNHIQLGRVFVNGKEVTQISRILKVKDIISIRGVGKIRLTSIGKMTKKNRIVVEIDHYQ
ncbi:YlmH/Sll1252 family protein [Petrocella sp. FN5]|uniref:YlmH/Sll1252 family protein n=1 Tax=Petrocella sp. FN5 TaxID=3032002 RepID=UPI0023D9A151|nr:YlmH/Sll1252 family protein [Petrocella sp. FN5]MDF1616312.1 YlmH/Sll1252 family protein [Petrocella sp. FN5]